MNDSELIRAARAGDEQAWNAIYQHLHGPVLGYLRIRGADDPENLLGEVFLRMARGIHRFRGDLGGLKAYAMTTAANLLRDQARRQAVRPRLVLEEPAEIEGASARRPGHAASAEEAALAAQGLTELEHLLDRLTVDQREVLYMRFVADLSLAETAKAMRRSTGAVKQLQHRALEVARDALRAETGEGSTQ